MANLVNIFIFLTRVQNMLAMVPDGLFLMEILLIYLRTISLPGLVHNVDALVITKQSNDNV